MSVAIEAMGEVGTGAALAHAVEPATGVGAPAAAHTACLNCGTALVGRYCHGCGQSSHVHRTLMSIVHDLLHGVFHFEGKIWRTVPMLVLHPGQLTRRYIDGERARFVSPLALFLFSVFLMFAVYSTFAANDMTSGIVDGWNSVPPAEQAADKAKARLSQARLERVRAAAAHQATAAADGRIARLEREVATLDKAAQRAAASRVKVRSRWRWLDDGLQRAKDNPGLVIYKVQSAAYKYSWLLIFLSTPFVALTFLWRRTFTLYDHATFVTYSITFMSLLAIVFTLMAAAGAPSWLILPLLLLAPPTHMFAQLRGAYSLGWFGALWRTSILLVVAWTTLVFFVVGVIALEVAG